MWISKFRILSIASFDDSGWITLSPNINLFIGQNNSGKSALLRSLAGPPPKNPHRTPDSFLLGDVKKSRVEINFQTSVREIVTRLESVGGDAIFMGSQGAAGAEFNRILAHPDEPLEVEGLWIPNSSLKRRTQSGINNSMLSKSGENLKPLRVASNEGGFKVVSRSTDPSNLCSVFDHKDLGTFFYFAPERQLYTLVSNFGDSVIYELATGR